MRKFPSFLRAGRIPDLPHPAAAATGRRTPHRGGASGHRHAEADTRWGSGLPQVTGDHRTIVFQSASLLLGYPTDAFDDVLAAVSDSLGDLPAPIADELGAFTQWAVASGRREVEQRYVETFDQKRRCCLELSYFATGDTRQRGIALTIFRDLYRAVGWELIDTDLPDFLPNVLELSARCHSDSDRALVDAVVSSHREGIEILHAALTDMGSPWAHVVAALRLALPAVDESTAYRLQKLIRQGPPQELVGATGAEALPWPTTSDPGPDGFAAAVAATATRALGTTTATPVARRATHP